MLFVAVCYRILENLESMEAASELSNSYSCGTASGVDISKTVNSVDGSNNGTEVGLMQCCFNPLITFLYPRCYNRTRLAIAYVWQLLSCIVVTLLMVQAIHSA